MTAKTMIRLLFFISLVGLTLLLLADPAYEAQSAPLACPANPAGLPDTLERPNFCVFYDDADTSDAQAIEIANDVDSYWNRYADLGFLPPHVTGAKLEVHIEDDSCNGTAWSNYIKVNNGCFNVDDYMQKVVGHEIFHRIQFAYDTDWDPNWSTHKWLYEGSARAVEDRAFANIDNWADAMSANSSFNNEVNDYLANTNADVTSDGMRYESALFWAYFMDQYGTTNVEPQIGIDAMETLWDQTATSSDIAAVNNALAQLGAGHNFDEAFRRFTAANWLKDLNGAPAAYNYVDEDQLGNPAPYGPIMPTTGGPISTGIGFVRNNQPISRYGASYYRTSVGNNCPLISTSLNTDSGPAFYHVITEKNGALDFFDTSTASSWNRSFFNDGVSHVTVIAGSTSNDAMVDIKVECLDPVLDIKLPNSGAVAYVGPSAGPGKILAQVLVTNGTPNGPVIDGLAITDFKAVVGTENALVLTGGFIQEQYWLVIKAPNQASDGLYDLEISLEASGTTTTLATDTNADSVSYTADNVDHLLVLDRSGSMNSDGKFIAAQNAANFFIDITRNNDGLAVIPYHTDVDPAPFALQQVTVVPNVRANAENFVDGLNTGNLTSIGDGMQEAADQRNATPTSNPLCSIVLLSDGVETAGQYWSSASADVIATGCPVTTIAFGEASNETLMQEIATQTGGLFFYNDVFVSARAAEASTLAEMNLELGNSYEYAQAQGEGRTRLLHERGVVPTLLSETELPPDQIHTVYVDDTVTEIVFSLDWASINEPDCDNSQVSNGCFGKDLDLKLIKPDGKAIDPNQLDYTFEDIVSGHVGWRVANPQPGEWTLVVNADSFYVWYDVAYQVIVSGQSSLTAELLLPDRTGARFLTGNKVPIYAFISSDQPLSGGSAFAEVIAPNGAMTVVPLYDDGQHGDGQPNDGFYGGMYTKVNQAQRVFPSGEDGAPPILALDDGAYQVRLQATLGKMQREALGAFSVKEGRDQNLNGVPDAYEEENGIDDVTSDADLDGLDAASEYQLGTDPNNSDTDGGGENDGSEFNKGQDPLHPRDDKIDAPAFLKVIPGNGFNTILYDVRPDYSGRILFRAADPNGPWSVRDTEMPASGMYEDEAENEKTYYYRYLATNLATHGSAIIDSDGVTPNVDTVAPEVDMLINDGVETEDIGAKLTFVEAGHDHGTELHPDETFDDIMEMRISNKPDFSDAAWQPFQAQVDWTLEPNPDGLAKVYAQFRDGAGNESTVTTAVAQLTTDGSTTIFLPIIVR